MTGVEIPVPVPPAKFPKSIITNARAMNWPLTIATSPFSKIWTLFARAPLRCADKFSARLAIQAPLEASTSLSLTCGVLTVLLRQFSTPLSFRGSSGRAPSP